MENELDGRLWISKEKHNFLGKGRIELLEHIGETGSITKAAKAMKMSYKAAWDAVDAMNNLSEKPLVERSTGGKGGGGTILTGYGREVVQSYKVLHQEHQWFLHNLSLRINENSGHLRLLERMTMRLSARNQLTGNVIKIYKGAINSEILIRLHGDDTIMAIITNESLKTLDIQIDTKLHAIFKAGTVMISSDLDAKFSAENHFLGTIQRINRGSVNSEVIIQLVGGNTICAMLSNISLDELKLSEDMEVLAFCKASDIILGMY